MHKQTFSYGEDHLTAGIAQSIARDETRALLSADTRTRIKASAAAVEKIVSRGNPVYGINTGFGPLCSTIIPEDQTRLLQENILKSHSAGVGEPITPATTKLMLILKVHALAKGFSGITETTLDRVCWHIENDILPLVPAQGSVGASGDLAPLAHLFLPLIGLGKCHYKGTITDTASIHQQESLEPIRLGPKEGLALINGTQFIAAFAVQIIERLHNCLAHADISGAMMVEALLGSAKPFLDELHLLRPYTGNRHVAARIKTLLEDSAIVASHADCSRVQDPYSLRCMPQVHGTSRNAWLHLKESLEIELNAVTDNPVVFNEDLTISGGNFHGQPLALPIDYACLAASELGNIADRRVYLALEGIAPRVPKLLMRDTGIHSGFMILQYTTAALASENKCLCFPASADSIPTSLGQEDHVSMGSIGARKALLVIDNLEKILAIELLCAAQALDFHRPVKSNPHLQAIHDAVRQHIDHAAADRVFATDIEKALALLRSGLLLKLANIKTPFDELFENY